MTAHRKQRIAYVNHTGKVSGAEKILLSMLRGLDRTRFEPVVLCPAEGNLRQMVEEEGIPCAFVPTLNARFTWRPGELLRYMVSVFRVMLAMRDQIARVNPDFVHANSVRAGIVATLATIGTSRPVVWHVHDNLPRHPLSVVIRLLAYASKRTRIVAVSRATAEAFSGSVPFKDRIQVIHNGIDLSRFPLKGEKAPLKDELGISQRGFLVCAVGQICYRKGLRDLLEAFSQIYDDAPEVHLAIVGKPVFPHEEAHRDELVAMAIAAGIADRAHFAGERNDISAVMQSTDLLVLNSLEEPFGLVLVEAMSCGTPVLATRVGGIPEIVSDRESGWLIDRGDTSALASKLLELSRDPASLDRVARFARESVCPRFSIERFLADLHMFYERLSKLPCTEQIVQAPVVFAGLHDPQGDQHV